MTVLPALERMLGDAADRLASDSSAAAARRFYRWWPPWQPRRALALVAVLVLGGASAAWAAGVFQTGAAITTAPGYAPRAHYGWGAPVSGSLKLLSLRAADPAGGPPWGLGVFETTEGLACPVAARVVNGRLGALGIDYTFRDDGRFHQLLPAPATGFGCQPPDAHGDLFLAGFQWLVSASGETASATSPSQVPACLFPGEQGSRLRCAPFALRSVLYGFLGPDARTIAYTYNGVHHVEALAGPDGGYLIVLQAPSGIARRRAVIYGDVEPPVTPSVTYRGGLRCALSITGPSARPGLCRTVGYQPGPAEVPAAATVKTTAAIAYHKAVTVGLLQQVPALTIEFTARADTSTRYSYVAQLHPPTSEACRAMMGRAGGGIPLHAASIGATRAGQTVTLAIPLEPRCAGRYTGTLTLRREARWPFPFEGSMDRLGVDRAETIPITKLAETVP